jgi:hypothetical protein
LLLGQIFVFTLVGADYYPFVPRRTRENVTKLSENTANNGTEAVLIPNNIVSWFTNRGPEGTFSKAIHQHEFVVSQSLSTLTLRAEGMSYREIARAVGIHFTRVQQILREAKGR